MFDNYADIPKPFSEMENPLTGESEFVDLSTLTDEQALQYLPRTPSGVARKLYELNRQEGMAPLAALGAVLSLALRALDK